MKRFEIEHTTRFTYSGLMTETMMELRLMPLDGRGQRLLDFRLQVSPQVKVATYRDGYGNLVHYFNLLRAHRKLRITSRSLVEMDGANTTPEFLISRYSGASPEDAPLHALGSGQWEKAKRKAAQQVRGMTTLLP